MFSEKYTLYSLLNVFQILCYNKHLIIAVFLA